MADLHAKTLFASDGVQITAVLCQTPKSGWAAEETVESPRLIFPRRGVFECRHGQTTWTADANIALSFNQNDAYRVSHPADGGDDCSVFVFAPDVLGEVLAADRLLHAQSETRPFPGRYILIEPALQYCQRWLHHQLRQDPLEALAAEETSLNLLSRTAAQMAGQPGTGLRPPAGAARAYQRRLAEEVRSLIATQPGEPLSLNDLARRVHCSPYHLARLFHAEVGTPIHNDRLRLRLALALERLAQGEDNLSLLAAELGFTSHSHLSSGFRRRSHCR